MKHPFKAWDWDGGGFIPLKTNDVVEAIHIAWNYEFDVYRTEDDELIFSGGEDNEGNSEMLEPYGLKLIDHEGYRVLQNTKTGEIYKPSWQHG